MADRDSPPDGAPQPRQRSKRPRRGRRSNAERAERRTSPERREADRSARIAARPASISYPPELPVVALKDRIAEAIDGNQVVIVAGETGSGKTTQLPKICLDLGRGVEGVIGHTQPRRIAARSVAERVSHELAVDLGTAVGYQVRFTDRSTDATAIKVMTDGILLAELSRDRDLRRYDTLIIDEAHERSLTIDFLLGYLKGLLPRRPDLKVIITSATIDVDRFADHFATPEGTPAPVIEVSGRSYPVEVRYRPLTRPGPVADNGTRSTVEIDQVAGVCEAVEELWTEDLGGRDGGPSDILVFCSGEREIRDTTDALNGLRLPDTEVLPLYGRLSVAEQHRIFTGHPGRRIVVSTNVAETSLTVPGIRYVVDTGTARISRYSQRLKVQRLPIEPISRASAAQRSGRCGRLAPGIAIRLYSEDDFDQRPEFTDPEILRTNLASVILQMSDLGLGEMARFPFIDPPDDRQVADGVRLLQELQALHPRHAQGAAARSRRQPGGGPRLTAMGRTIARLPLDPRLARMLIEADRIGCLDEVLVITAALSIQDPRERPAEKQTQADQSHARFREGAGDSDFISLLNLWRYLRTQQRERSGSSFRRMCQREFLHYLRVREWQDLHTQLRRACKDTGMTSGMKHGGPAAAPDTIHQALLTGLLSHVGMWDQSKREYLGARGARFAIQPGSALFRSRPDWLMSAELVETTRLWARVNAVIDPAWVERAAAHLVRRSYAEPRWSRKRASAVADERVSLYGIPVVAGRPVAYGSIDPEVSRDLFIRHALVEGEWDTGHAFFAENRRLIRRLGDLEARARRRDLVVDDEVLVDFYDQRVPAEVVSGAHFDTWWKKARKGTPDLLAFTEDLLLRDAADQASATDYPGTWRQGDLELQLSYVFSPGSERDGVTCHIPIEILNQVEASGFDYLVPGLRLDLVTAMIRALPKPIRRGIVPATDAARDVCASLAAAPGTEPYTGAVPERTMAEAVAAGLTSRARAAGVVLSAADIDTTAIPDHLRMTFSVERRQPSRKGKARVEVIASGKDLSALREELAPQVRETMASVASSIERTGLTSWPDDLLDLPDVFEQQIGGRAVLGYPALVDNGASVDLRVLSNPAAASAATRLGLRRLTLLGTEPPWKRLLSVLDNQDKLVLASGPHTGVPELLNDALAAAVDQIISTRPHGAAESHGVSNTMPGRAPVRTPEAFRELLAETKVQVIPMLLEVIAEVVPVVKKRAQILSMLDAAVTGTGHGAVIAREEREHLDALVGPGFITAAGMTRLPDLRRYLAGIAERLEKGAQNPARDAARASEIADVQADLADFIAGLDPADRLDRQVHDVAWQVEELRVSLFAQRLGTPAPVSTKRIHTAMDQIESRLR